MNKESWMPWLDSPWERWRSRMAENKLPHAVLVEGPAGTGKRRFARRLCAAFLCTSDSQQRPCDECRACRWLAAGSHPDFHVLSPEDSREITVPQVRRLIERLMLSGSSGRRAAVIDPAQCFNRSSANAFLKTLEEPPAGVLLVLVAEQTARLPATILSRCQRETIHAPDSPEALEWLRGNSEAGEGTQREALALAGGSPGEALRMMENDALAERKQLIADLESLARGKDDPVSTAERWQKTDVDDALAWMSRWLATAAGACLRNDDSSTTPLQLLLSGVDCSRIFEMYDQVNRARAELETQLRTDLLLESLLQQWCRLAGSREEAIS